MKLNKIGATLLALALGLGGAAIATSPASAHTGDLSVTAVCNTVTGEYDLTATLDITNTTLSGATKWDVGTPTFTGTPSSSNGLTRGPIITPGAGLITLGSFSLPGSTTGKGPWVYAYTNWTDGFGKGSDGQLLTNLAGDCKAPDKDDALAAITPSAGTCAAAGSASVTTLVNATWDGTLDTSVGTHIETFTANAGSTFPGGAKSLDLTYTVPDKDTSLCPTVTQCVTITQGDAFTNLNTTAANFAETRATGHAEFTVDGLHIWTEGTTSTDKVAFYTNAYLPASWTALGEPSISYTGSGGATPGFQLGADRDGNGTWDGYVVREPAYAAGYWWSNKAFGVPAGAGYPSFAPLGGADSYLSNNPNIAPTNYGFSLGSGVKGDFVVKSLTIGCVEHPFKYIAPPAPITGNDVVETTDCTTEDVTIVTTPYTQTASIVGGAWVYGPKVYGAAVTTTRAATAAELNAANCPPPAPPTPKVTTTVKEQADCTKDTVAVQTTVTTETYTYDAATRTWVKGADDVKVTDSTRAQTAIEKALCPLALAYTGLEQTPQWVWFGGGALVLIGLALVMVRKFRKARRA